MRQQTVQHWILGVVVISTFFWLDLVQAEALRRVALITLVWASASTLLVASAGACIAFARIRQERRD
ncbi:hypothetical protein E2C06_11745 [Dankookia rubra]|uniref:Uncharacterized protein n=1 Tax=Dankookia rubra TaxID=1442381 RepID=A0A4R5QGV8_9PROT|nr:hypothetical protein [Dankookia rubra]TDH62530.1 hypothetical protein E2C06_11745 [Dankookia rubra]